MKVINILNYTKYVVIRKNLYVGPSIILKFDNISIHSNIENNRIIWNILNVQFDILYVCKTETKHAGNKFSNSKEYCEQSVYYEKWIKREVTGEFFILTIDYRKVYLK